MAPDTLNVVVSNAIPDVDAGPDAIIVEGGTFASAGSFTDPGSDTWTGTVDYGDGSGPQPLALNPDGSFALDHGYADDGVYNVTVAITDDDGGVGTDAAVVTVNNVAPIVEAGADQFVLLGTPISLDPAIFTDPGLLDTHTAVVDWGDGVTLPGALTQGSGAGSVDATHSYSAVGTYTVTVTVTDNDGGTGSDTFTVGIVQTPNTPPIVDAGPDGSIDEGDFFVSAGSFSDPDTNDWTGTVDYGDSGAPQTLSLNADKSFALSHSYADDSVYTVMVTIDDGAGGVGVDTASVVVHNVPPTVDAGPDQTVNTGDTGDTVNFSGSFTDPGSDDTHTIEWDFGDGSPAVTGTLTPSHSYPGAGAYTVRLTVTDDDGGAGADTLTVTVEGGTQPEPPISDLYARAKDSKIDLVWAPIAGASGYNVYRATSQGGPYSLIAGNHQCSYCAYADFGLTNGTTYYYVVRWINATGESEASNEANATPAARTRSR